MAGRNIVLKCSKKTIHVVISFTVVVFRLLVYCS